MGGFPNLKWNRNNVFDTFIPATQTKLDTLMTYETFSGHIKPTIYTKDFSSEEYDYIVVVVWADYMGRQTKKPKSYM